MSNVPLWLLHVLYDTRQATLAVEKKILQSEADMKTYQANMQGCIFVSLSPFFLVSIFLLFFQVLFIFFFFLRIVIPKCSEQNVVFMNQQETYKHRQEAIFIFFPLFHSILFRFFFIIIPEFYLLLLRNVRTPKVVFHESTRHQNTRTYAKD